MQDDNSKTDSPDLSTLVGEAEFGDGIDLTTLWGVTKDELGDIDPDNPNPVMTGQIATRFADGLARAVFWDEATDTEADPMMKQFARTADMKKSAVENQFEQAKKDLKKAQEEHDAKQNAVAPDTDDKVLERSITFLLHYMLEELVIYEPSDASVKIRYNWKFDNGVEVETETEHLGPDSFCQTYHDASGGRLNATTPENFEGSWTEYIRNFVAEKRDEGEVTRVVSVEGLRTQAVDDLKDTIEAKPATTDQKVAAQQYRPYVETVDANVVQIPSASIERIIADFEDVTYNDIQIELDKRGHRAGNVRATQVGNGGRGTNVRFWQLHRGWLDIEVEEPEDETDYGDTDDE